MKVDVRFRGLDLSETLREYIQRRIEGHLGHFSQRLDAVTVRIGDVNGPKGGVDKQCSVLVRGPGFSDAVVREIDADPYAAVDRAAERTGRVVSRQLERTRTWS